MSKRKMRLLAAASCLLAPTVAVQAQRGITQDTELKEIDLSKWDCLDSAGGSAKTPDGVERNQGKNRPPADLAGKSIPSFDEASFLKHVSAFDEQTKFKRRSEITAAQKTQLAELETQLVSLTGYLNYMYPGPPESTNCGSVDYHDWHLEVFAQPTDHPPRAGDPTPIIAEITPRTQNQLFRDGVRLQTLSAFFRNPELGYDATGHKAVRVKITGYLLWDDDHNGRADVGPRIEKAPPNKYHNPWRATAWEIHPVLRIEALDGNAPPVVSPPASATPAAAAAPVSAPSPQPASTPAATTLLQPVRVKIPYGETTLPRGMKLEVLAQDAQSVTVRYMGSSVRVPRGSTDLPPSPATP